MHSLYINQILENVSIKSIKYQNYTYKLIFQDDFIMYIQISIDDKHKYYTFLETDNPEYHYTGKMPHDSYDEIYNEVIRMSSKNTRTKK